MPRIAKINRQTAETKIELELNLDGTGQSRIATGVGFFDHMLTLWTKHSACDLSVVAQGDLVYKDLKESKDEEVTHYSEELNRAERHILELEEKLKKKDTEILRLKKLKKQVELVRNLNYHERAVKAENKAERLEKKYRIALSSLNESREYLNVLIKFINDLGYDVIIDGELMEVDN